MNVPTWVWLWISVPLLAVAGLVAFQLVHGWRLQRRVNGAVKQLRAGDPAGAEAEFRLLLAEGEQRRDPILQRFSLVNLSATLISQRRQAEARPLLQRAAALAGQRGKPRESAPALYNLAWSAFLDRDFETAAQLNTQAQAAAANRAQVDLAALFCLMDGRLATRGARFEDGRLALGQAVAHAANARDRDLVHQVAIAQGVLEYRAGNRAGLDLALDGAQRVVTADRQDLVARWLTGLSVLARTGGDQDAAGRLEAAVQQLARNQPFPSPEECATYLKA